MIPLEVPRAVKFMETESRLVVARGRGRANGELLFDGFQLCKMKRSWRWMVVTVAQQWKWT